MRLLALLGTERVNVSMMETAYAQDFEGVKGGLIV